MSVFFGKKYIDSEGTYHRRYLGRGMHTSSGTAVHHKKIEEKNALFIVHTAVHVLQSVIVADLFPL